MNCSRELITGVVDGELGPLLKTKVERHLASCRACADEYSQILEQQWAIRSLPYYNAPAHLRQSVRDALKGIPLDKPNAKRRNESWRFLAIAASMFLMCSLAWNLYQLRDRTPRDRTPEVEIVAESILSSHVRSLIGTHLLDVVSTDQHTVKPWFNGKVDFSPVVKDLSSQGFPLIGGRIEYLSGRAGVALVYQRRKHIINLFTWPSTAAGTQESQLSQNGYNELHWSDRSMAYWAVSDLGLAELQEFKALWMNLEP